MNGLSEKDIMVDLLNDTKLASEGYHHAMVESANDNVWNTFMRLHNDELTGARLIFNLMHQRGWYPVEAATQTASAYQQQTAGYQQQTTGHMGTF